MRKSHEVYQFLTVAWDVSAAWAYIEHTNRAVEDKLKVAELMEQMGSRYIDKERAMSDAVNPYVPLVLGTWREGWGDKILLDGAHRLYKAQQQGIQELDYVLLTREETIRFEEEGFFTHYKYQQGFHACGQRVGVTTQDFNDPGTGLKHRTQWFTQVVTSEVYAPGKLEPEECSFSIPMQVCLTCNKPLSCNPHVTDPAERVRLTK